MRVSDERGTVYSSRTKARVFFEAKTTTSIIDVGSWKFEGGAIRLQIRN